MNKKTSYVCVLSTNNYLPGVLILNENLKDLNSKYDLLCLINENINERTRRILDFFKIKYKEMQSIDHPSEYGHWKYTFDKLNIYSLVEYEKIVYLDVDIVIKENIDELFDVEAPAACLDLPWYKDRLCSGALVIKPNLDDYFNLIGLLRKKQYDGDQDVLNDYYKKFTILDKKYCVTRALDLYNKPENEKLPIVPLIKYFDNEPADGKIFHYIGSIKPFMVNKPYDAEDYQLFQKYTNTINKKIIEMMTGSK